MPSNPRDAKQPTQDKSGGESYGGTRRSGLKIRWAERPVWVRIPPRLQSMCLSGLKSGSAKPVCESKSWVRIPPCSQNFLQILFIKQKNICIFAKREVRKELIRWVIQIVVRTPLYRVTLVAVPQRAAPNKGIANWPSPQCQ